MNKILYANGGFYPFADKDIYERAAAWPSSGVEITEAERDDLLAGERSGMRITLGPAGRPMLVQPPPALPVVPTEVTKKQGELALVDFGFYERYVDLVQAADLRTRVACQAASTFKRNDPFLIAMAAGLELSETDLDSLFTHAATL